MPAVTEEKKKEEEREVRMTFGEHLEELRRRLIKAVAFLGIAIIACLFFSDELIIALSQPHFKAMGKLRIDPGQARFIAESYTTWLMWQMKLAMIVGLFVSSPWVGYQLWAFVSAGLYRKEKKHVQIFAPLSFLLFMAGCAFGFYCLVPGALEALAGAANPKVLDNSKYLFAEYLNLIMILTIIMGGVFQLPLIMVFVAKIGLVKPSTLNSWSWRRASIVINVILAATLTPTGDPITLAFVSVPLMILYELGVLISYVVARPKAEAKA